jgi:hypothetical protein
MKKVKQKKKLKSLPKLKAEAQTLCNEYIRRRDEGKPCITCGGYVKLEAGHFYPVKTYDGLRYELDNIHGECHYDNCFNDFHLISYQNNLINRIGAERMAILKQKAEEYKINGHKFSRSELLDIITQFKQLIAELPP